jgi:hypothetical protein
MTGMERRVFLAALAAGLLAVACSKSEPPPPPAPPPKVEAPAAPGVNDELKRLAREVYVYAYPLVLMDVTRQVATAKTPINTFQHKRAFPDPSSTDVADPNVDMLYSTAWLDLSNGPVILSVPDTKGRYYLMAMHDAWSNVFQSPGKRTIGTEKREFAIIGPKWKGEVPKNAEEIRSPTDTVWIIGRTQTNGRGDLAAVAKLQDQYKLMPLSHAPKGGKGPAQAASSAANVDVKTPPREQVAKMDAQAFFTRVAMLLPGNPPAKEDTAMTDRMKKLGIVAGQPFDTSKLDPAAANAVKEGAKSGLDAIVAAASGTTGDIRNGWTINWDLGRYGTNYGLRAVIASTNLGANAPEDAIAMRTRLDSGGHPLNGANKYVLHLDKGKPPPAEAFWSLTMYNDKQLLVANPLERYAIGDRDKPHPNPDGSLDIFIQHDSPGRDKESNWLPAPKENFTVILRIYSPKGELLQRRWEPPAIRPAA